jgi:hypothetical protein
MGVMTFPRVQPQPFVPPLAIRRLPLDLQRTSLITHDPQAVAAAVMRWQGYMQGAPMPTVLPKTVLHQAWKRQPGLVTTAPYNDPLRIAASAVAALAFMGKTPPGVMPQPAYVAPMGQQVAAQGYNELSRAPGKVAAATVTQQRPLDQPLTPPEAIFRHNVAQEVAARMGREIRETAFRSAATARARAMAPLLARRW